MPALSSAILKTQNALALIESGKYLLGAFRLCLALFSDSEDALEIFKGLRSISSCPFKQEELLLFKESATDSFCLGLCYLAGIAVPQSDIHAAGIFLALKNRKDVPADVMLAWMYQQGRAGLDLPNQAARDAVALKYYSMAAILYLSTYSSLQFQMMIDDIMSFQESKLRTYALARARAKEGAHLFEQQWAALRALEKPSDYLLFVDDDMKHFGGNPAYREVLFNKLCSFVADASDFEEKERVSLLKLTLKIIGIQLNNCTRMAKDLIVIQLKQIEPYLKKLFHVNLNFYLAGTDTEINASVLNSSVKILSLLLALDLPQHQELLHLFSTLIIKIPESSAFWHNCNHKLIHLLCAVFTDGQYSVIQSNKNGLDPEQFKALFMHVSRLIVSRLSVANNSEESGLEIDTPPLLADETSLRMMNQYNPLFFTGRASVLQRLEEDDEKNDSLSLDLAHLAPICSLRRRMNNN